MTMKLGFELRQVLVLSDPKAPGFDAFCRALDLDAAKAYALLLGARLDTGARFTAVISDIPLAKEIEASLAAGLALPPIPDPVVLAEGWPSEWANLAGSEAHNDRR
ncbi:hypothetical protein DR950_35965 [Kitasatospora xanthocidica]|uniref:Uncharacterized protein n=1 Tax=Kitasatospora xanthocidica TaxID=83382 RepID=A0A373A2Q1_9ACTN|nr:hypothetical protein [Kitasatospora xanthocidica]RGD62433.1 hypothetical protein DR950_35965 [Kitasatospora xanthocidica]